MPLKEPPFGHFSRDAGHPVDTDAGTSRSAQLAQGMAFWQNRPACAVVPSAREQEHSGPAWGIFNRMESGGVVSWPDRRSITPGTTRSSSGF